MPKWLLPEHVADVLPAEARRIEDVRRRLLDLYRTYGYELVFPPLLEYLDALLTGSGRDLDLHTLKVVDQLSGRTMGLRADITPQVARIDAHLLNRSGIARLCYAGSTVHALPRGLHATREPFQIGAELYGHAGIEADQEIVELALASARLCDLEGVRVDLSHVGVFRAIVASAGLDRDTTERVIAIVLEKDVPALRALAGVPPATARALEALCRLFGGLEVLDHARAALRDIDGVEAAIDQLQQLAHGLPAGQVSIDLGELRGMQYHSGMMFAVYCAGAPTAVMRGGRYDEVGRAFGRARPATGFSVDLRDVAAVLAPASPAAAILAPWSEDAELRAVIARLRARGETVVQDLPHREDQRDEFACDRALRRTDRGWTVVPIETRS